MLMKMIQDTWEVQQNRMELGINDKQSQEDWLLCTISIHWVVCFANTSPFLKQTQIKRRMFESFAPKSKTRSNSRNISLSRHEPWGQQHPDLPCFPSSGLTSLLLPESPGASQEAQICWGINKNRTHVAPTSMYLEVPPFCIGDNNLQLHVE